MSSFRMRWSGCMTQSRIFSSCTLAIAESDPDLARPLVDGLPHLRAEAIFAVRYEMATTLDDVLSRRTRARLKLRDASAAAAPSVAALIAGELGWDDAERDRQIAEYLERIAADRAPLDAMTSDR